jgi:cellulose synthase/poly-beta-1,6-N-acetylglucosamine synthase-like glycosyltransferase
MDIQVVLFYLFAVVSTLYVVHIGIYLIGANLYDIWQYRRRYKQRSSVLAPLLRSSTIQAKRASDSMSSLPEAEAPLVTIAIPAHNEEKVIVRCLDSIRRSSYPNLEVMVADDASHDRTWQMVRDYILRYPEMNLSVYRMHKNVGKGKALSTVLKRYASGEFAMMIDADSLISHDAIVRAISYFETPSIAGVAANVQIIHEPTVLGILQKFEHMIGYRSKKLYSVLNSEFVVGGVASTYRMSVLRQVDFYDTDTVTEDIGLSIKIVSLGNRTHRMVYGSDVLAMTEGVASFRALIRQRFRWKYGSLQNLVKYRSLIGNVSHRYTISLTMYRLPMAVMSEIVLLTAPIAWSYAAYMTLRQYSPQLILGAYATITVYMLITIWFDENLRLAARLRLSIYAPIAYFVFYIMEFVQLIAIMRCLYRVNTLIRQKDVGSTWVSPERVGKELAAIRET